MMTTRKQKTGSGGGGKGGGRAARMRQQEALREVRPPRGRAYVGGSPVWPWKRARWWAVAVLVMWAVAVLVATWYYGPAGPGAGAARSERALAVLVMSSVGVLAWMVVAWLSERGGDR